MQARCSELIGPNPLREMIAELGPESSLWTSALTLWVPFFFLFLCCLHRPHAICRPLFHRRQIEAPFRTRVSLGLCPFAPSPGSPRCLNVQCECLRMPSHVENPPGYSTRGDGYKIKREATATPALELDARNRHEAENVHGGKPGGKIQSGISSIIKHHNYAHIGTGPFGPLNCTETQIS